MRDRTAAERTKTFPGSGEIHVRNRNLFSLDVPPDIHLGPIEQRLYEEMFAFCSCGYKLAPEFRRLILVFPFKLRVARCTVSHLRTRAIFVTTNAVDKRVA